MDGLEATRRIHQRWPEGRRPHIIAATASAMPEEREACLAVGMDDYLSKPIRVDELAAALRRCRPYVVPQLPAPAGGSGEGAQVPPERERQGQPAIAGVLHPLEHGQTDEVRRAAHTLKSNGATFGAMSLSELSRQLEALAGSGILERADELIVRIDAEYERVRIALETVREGTP
jgi:DNA-binding response OmpR family regulator